MLSRKPWSFEAAGRLFIAVVLTLFCGMAVSGAVDSPQLHWTEDQRNLAEMAIMTVFFDLAALLWIGFFLRRNLCSWREAFFSRRPTFGLAGLGLAVGAVAAVGLVLLQSGLAALIKKVFHVDLQTEELVQRLGSPSISEVSRLFIGFTAIAVAPVAEETLFRGVLYPTIKQTGYPRAALWLTSLVFAFLHGSTLAFVPLTLFSMLLIWLYEFCDNLLAPILAHSAFNAVNYFFIVAAAFGPAGKL